jgi:hypothetical protein
VFHHDDLVGTNSGSGRFLRSSSQQSGFGATGDQGATSGSDLSTLAGSGLTTDLTTIGSLVDALKHGGHGSGGAGNETTPTTGIGSALSNLDGQNGLKGLLNPDGSKH